MKKVKNEALIARLNAIYEESRAGKPVRGSETKQKAWFYDEEIDKFVLVNIDRVPLFKIPSTEL